MAADAERAAGETFADRLARLASGRIEHPALGDPLAAYRHLPGRPRGVADQLAGVCGAERPGASEPSLAEGRHGALALAHWTAADFESACLERSIAQLVALVAWGDDAAAPTAGAALSRALDAARAGGVELMLAKSPDGDTLAARVLHEAGFVPIARKLTSFYCAAYAPGVAPIRARHTVRRYRPADFDAIIALGSRFQTSQYRRLPGIGAGGVDRLYRRWIERACGGEFADDVLVADSAGRPVGFSSFKLRADCLQATRLRVLGHGLGAVAPHASGALIALILAMQDLVHRGTYDAAEFDFYEENLAVRRALERLGFRQVAAATVMFRAL